MALQDLTPQLRTRLSRMERAVGWFVLLATALLVFGFAYYVYNTARRKGWFLTKAPYFTFTDRATGIRVGDPVRLMGLDVGQVTLIRPMPPDSYYSIYVEFEIKSPNYGYIWTDGSRAKVATSDFLGNRVVEVTKGTNGYATYLFHPLRVNVTLAEAGRLQAPQKWVLAEEIYQPDTTNLIGRPMTPLSVQLLQKIGAAGIAQIRVADQSEEKKSMTAVWNDKEGRYDPYGKTNLYWLLSDESPALTDRLEQLVQQVEKALPNILTLTNQLAAVLANGASAMSNLDAVLATAKPAVSNLSAITAQLQDKGSLGEWLLPTNVNQQLQSALARANDTLVTADTNLVLLVDNLGRSLDNLANLTSNLNAQVQSNTNMLGQISTTIVHTDDLVQGLKRHWLLRSAFRAKATNGPPRQPLLPPKSK